MQLTLDSCENGGPPPLPKMGGEEGLRFRKSPELAAYSAADSPEKVRVQKQDSPGPQPISQKPVFSMF